jgi:hypothetical protein
VIIYQLTRCRIPRGLNLQQHRRQNLKFRNISTVAFAVTWDGAEESLWVAGVFRRLPNEKLHNLLLHRTLI